MWNEWDFDKIPMQSTGIKGILTKSQRGVLGIGANPIEAHWESIDITANLLEVNGRHWESIGNQCASAGTC